MLTKEEIFQRREAIIAMAKRHGASDIRIFGSVARGDAAQTSDLDLIVKFEPRRTLLDHAGLIGDLEDYLGVKVDVIDAEGMQQRFRDAVEREAVPL
jgi:uncharacterized protein